MTTLAAWRCDICGWKGPSRTPRLPQMCPRCHSWRWNIGKQRGELERLYRELNNLERACKTARLSGDVASASLHGVTD